MGSLSKFSTFTLLLGLVCLTLSFGIDCRSNRLAEISKVALHFLSSENSQKLASLDVKLSVDQTRELLQWIRDSPTQELFTQQRASELIQVSKVEINNCEMETFAEIDRLMFITGAFPNIQRYLKHYKLEQLKKCKEFLDELRSKIRFSEKELEILGLIEPSFINSPQPSVEKSAEIPTIAEKPSNGRGNWKSRLIPRCFHQAQVHS